MPRFPKREADVYALAQEMIAGYLAQPAIFVHADVNALQNALFEYQGARQWMLCWEARPAGSVCLMGREAPNARGQ